MNLINLPKLEVIDYLLNNNIDYRVIKEEDISFIVTKDYKPERYNLTIKDGCVIEIKKG